GKELADMWELKNSGVVAISDDGDTIQSADLMLKILKYTKMLGLPYLCHAEDQSFEGVMHEGMISTELGLGGRPSIAEDIIVARDIILAGYENAQVHFCHVSTKGAAEQVNLAKKKGLAITAEACPHHFSLTDEQVKGYNQNARVSPPLRDKEHVNAIKKALRDDVIDVIATDHAPHLPREKYVEFDDSPPGLVGLETAVPLTMNNLVHAKILNISQAIEKMTINPARILKIPAGTLSIGANADVTIIDPTKEEIINPDEFETKGRNTLYGGMKLKGIPVMTIVRGKVVMKDRKVIV
ncbi:MAG TPA: dihydroorotase, partial [Candidatus Nanoarchaeia archaeon]|nr:dihydroorotase [Candidatus Nanoarchaeia archaeon]